MSGRGWVPASCGQRPAGGRAAAGVREALRRGRRTSTPGARGGGREPEFAWRGGALVDVETGSTWDPGSGRAVDGELRGEALERVAYATAFDWAWADFYPETAVYGR